MGRSSTENFVPTRTVSSLALCALMAMVAAVAVPSGAAQASAPTVTVTSDTTQILNARNFEAYVTFSESVSGFGLDDLVITGGQIAGITTGIPLVDEWDFGIIIVPDVAATDSVSVSVRAGAVEDADGNANTASNTLTLEHLDFVSPAGNTVIHIDGRGYGRPVTLECPHGQNAAESNDETFVFKVTAQLDWSVRGAGYLYGFFERPGPIFLSQSGRSVRSGLAAYVEGGSTRTIYLNGTGYTGGNSYGVTEYLYPGTVGTVTAQVLAGTVMDEAGMPNPPSNVLHYAAGWKATTADARATEGEGATIEFVVELNGRVDCRTAKWILRRRTEPQSLPRIT